MSHQFQHDWRVLIGTAVEVRLNLDVVRTGVVDAVTADGQILWIAAEGLTQRTMFERARGYHVWAFCWRQASLDWRDF